jgi:2-polyprenyl-3-methyl-5-hydroxy-6-metoxy-1,4-benzoquinol methylase
MSGVHYDQGKELEKLREAFPNITTEVAGQVVMDYGCGFGYQAVALAEHAQLVYGIEINESCVAAAKALAEARNAADRTIFALRLTDGMKADAIVSRNSFEHFPQPRETLAEMAGALSPRGRLYITFSPPWYSPWGAHMGYFCKIPWVHLLFSETAVMTAPSVPT